MTDKVNMAIKMESVMKFRKYLAVAIGLLTLAVILSLRRIKEDQASRNLPPSISSPRPTSERPTPQGEVATGASGHQSDKSLSIPGIGLVHYASKSSDVITANWLRKISPKLRKEIAPNDQDIDRRNVEDKWLKTDVFYGEKREILHIEVNKNRFSTYPLDDVAISKLRDVQGLSILRVGFPDGLLDSGYSMEDFIVATYNEWDRGEGDDEVETEITPVIVKVVSVGRDMDGTRDPSLLNQEVPMILVKSGDYLTKDEYRNGDGTVSDQFDNSEVARRTWTLIEYIPKKAADGTIIRRSGGGVILYEPLMKAWKRRQADSSIPDRQ